MFYLIASLIILALTPLIVSWVSRHQRISRWGAGLLLLAIVYNIFTHIIFENVRVFGWMALLAAFMGASIFAVGDEFFFSQAPRRSRLFLVMVQVFLAVHAMIDGAALVGSELNGEWAGHHHGQELGLSIVLHRLLFEVVVWKYFLERHGRGMAAFVLLNIAVATVVGFFGSKMLFAWIPSYFGLFEAFIGGALLHLVYDYFKERLKGEAPQLVSPRCKKAQSSHIS